MEREALLAADVQPGGRPPSPPPLDLVQAFVNTVDREHGPDLLDDEEGLAEWLGRRGLGGQPPRSGDGRGARTAPAPVGPKDLLRARQAREALREILWANGGEDNDVTAAYATLDAAAERARLRPRFASGGLEANAGGVDGALGVVLAAAFAAIVDGSFARLKACPRDRCGWAFYDRSPAASATWCSMRVCGGREKARSYYRRRRRG
ncbi:MAG TPA: CGNR zinc finger domain-containing protein [Solirubrobacteraceae bacterium]